MEKTEHMDCDPIATMAKKRCDIDIVVEPKALVTFYRIERARWLFTYSLYRVSAVIRIKRGAGTTVEMVKSFLKCTNRPDVSVRSSVKSGCHI